MNGDNKHISEVRGKPIHYVMWLCVTECVVHPMSSMSFQLMNEIYLTISPLGERMRGNAHPCLH